MMNDEEEYFENTQQGFFEWIRFELSKYNDDAIFKIEPRYVGDANAKVQTNPE